MNLLPSRADFFGRVTYFPLESPTMHAGASGKPAFRRTRSMFKFPDLPRVDPYTLLTPAAADLAATNAFA